MRLGALCRGLALGLLGSTATLAQSTEPQAPRLTETAGVRLVQIEVTATGPAATLRSLRPDDLRLKVHGVTVESFQIDWMCQQDLGTAAPSRPTTFLLYFDMAHLTMTGRQQAMQMASEMLPQLVQGGNRAMILANAAAVTTVAGFSSDAAQLVAALKTLEYDRRLWDAYPSGEDQRLAQVVARLNKDGPDAAMGLARTFYLDDRWRGERNLKRLASVLPLLSSAEPPKAVLYFADTLRERPGEIYTKFFSGMVPDASRPLQREKFADPLLHVIRHAAAHGIRFYTVQAEGLAADSALGGVTAGSMGSFVARGSTLASTGTADAQAALGSMGTETGGIAFLNGVAPKKIVEAIRSDLSCLLLVSFDPLGLPEDQILRVKLTTRLDGVDLKHRGLLVVPSEAEQRTAMLLASMISPETSAQEIPLQLELVPTGFVDKSFTALVQLSVSGSSGNGGTWDLAASAVSGGRVTEDGSGRIVTSHAGAPVVLEREMHFDPGPYEIVGVAQNELTGALGSRREEGRWPDPDAQDAVVGPIAVLQPVGGAFLREGRASSTGALARGADETARTDRPTALVGLICRRRGLDGPLHVERVLVGETEAPFVPMDFLPEDGRCVQVRDLIPAGTLLEGAFRYQVRVVRNGAEIARGERRFVAVAPDTVPPAARGKPS